MKVIFLVLLLCFTAVSVFAEPSVINDKFISIPLKKVPTALDRYQKRSGVYDGPVLNENVTFITTVSVGTPSQELLCIVDTASINFWVTGTNCTGTACPSKKFNPDQSQTYQRVPGNFSNSFVKGSIRGNYALDKVGLSNNTVNNQTFATVTEVIQVNKTLSFSGVLGLGYPTPGSNKTSNSFLANLINQRIISNPVYTLSFSNNSQDSAEIILGGVDKTKYQGDLFYVSTSNNQSKWNFYVQGYGVFNGTNPYHVNLDTAMSVAVSTGTIMTQLPGPIAYNLLRTAVGTQNLMYNEEENAYHTPCSTKQSSAMIELNLSNSSEPSATPLNVGVPIGEFVLPYNSTTCIMSIVPVNITRQATIGISFLRSVFTVFDVGTTRIGIANSFNSNVTLLTQVPPSFP